MDEIFSIFHERMIKIVSSSDQVNAMEIVAVLSFVDSILKYHDTITQSRDVASMLIEDEVIDAGPYSIPSSFRLPRLVVSILMESREILERRLNDFIADEVNWIQSGKGGLTDAKMLGVFPAFQKFPLLLDVVEELTGSQVRSFL